MKETFELTKMEAAVIRRYGLSPEKLCGCSLRSYAFGEIILSEGLQNDYLFLVVSGTAKVGAAAPNGKNLILYFYISDGLIGEAELFSDAPVVSTSVIALENFRCIAAPAEPNREYLTSNPVFTRNAAAELARKLIRCTDRVVEATLYSSEVRLCRYILAASQGPYFRDIMTDVAYSVGISYRHLYRTIGTLCRDGILEKTDAGYRICDLKELNRRAGQH